MLFAPMVSFHTHTKTHTHPKANKLTGYLNAITTTRIRLGGSNGEKGGRDLLE